MYSQWNAWKWRSEEESEEIDPQKLSELLPIHRFCCIFSIFFVFLQEYGINKVEKLDIAYAYCLPLVRKIQLDLQRTHEDESVNKLHPLWVPGVNLIEYEAVLMGRHDAKCLDWLSRLFWCIWNIEVLFAGTLVVWCLLGAMSGRVYISPVRVTSTPCSAFSAMEVCWM